MKTKNIVLIQVVLLVAALIAGFVLKGDLADGPRMLHRALGSLATVFGLVGAIMLTREKADKGTVIASWATVVLGSIAGYAGMGLKTAENYDSMFNLMRGSGFLAFVLAVVVFVMIGKKEKAA
jgi:heme A synthase